MSPKLVLTATLLALAAPAAAQQLSLDDMTVSAEEARAAMMTPAPLAQPEYEAPAKASPEERARAERQPPLVRAAFWATEVRIDPEDAEAGIALARALRAMGQHDEAAASAERIALLYPDNADALLELARARIAQGEAFYAIRALRIARDLNPSDWRPVSLLGVAYEQVERHEDAWTTYHEALALSPENPAILSNIGMYLAVRGQAVEAESWLRRAANAPGATIQVRANLAYILGVQGKLREAEQILREDLPPALANNNLDYLRAISGQTAAASNPALRGG